RRGDLKSALPLWEEAANSNALIALVELAKYYEHQEKDYSIALEKTLKAIALNLSIPEASQPLHMRSDLLKRKTRLEQYLSEQNNIHRPSAENAMG
ncbi:MAG TPA: hypothetical protein VLR89_08170, partial [Anaerolineaceae bacterium]|nr:hypothetical protein [Anaerolineaceae bacterium]